MFDRNSPAWAHHNSSTKITALEGPNKGRSLKIQSNETMKMDPGNKVKTVPGAGSGPLTVISGAAEPSFEFKLSTNIETKQLAQLLGNTHKRFQISVTYTRPGLKRITYRAKGCMAEKGLGLDSSHDNGVSDTVSGKCSDITFQEEGGREFSVIHDDAEGQTQGGGGGGLLGLLF
ncbi:MAG TPA: hypothetical protein VGQ38_15345 [Gaiellaceae bacterium]|jgi:hypothetical protein|nr:hypothetical protein [Gaiellaceae bacterium]